MSIERNLWKTKTGEMVPMSEMSDEELNKANAILQERKTLLISSLEFVDKLETNLHSTMKARKIKVLPVEETSRKYIVNKFNYFKPVLTKMTKAFKALEKEQSKIVD